LSIFIKILAINYGKYLATFLVQALSKNINQFFFTALFWLISNMAVATEPFVDLKI